MHDIVTIMNSVNWNSIDQSGQDNLTIAYPEDLVTSQSSLIDEVEFAENQESRCPCVLRLDTSGSMRGRPIAALNAGLRTFQSHLVEDPVALKRVDVAVVAFDSRSGWSNIL